MADLQEIGMGEAVTFLKGLEERAQRSILLSSMKIAARPLVKEAKRLAPIAERNVREFWGKRLNVPPGTLARSIKYITPKRKSATMAELFVGPKKAKKRGRNYTGKTINNSDGWFRHFVIRGTAGGTIKTGKNKGRFIKGQEPNPFMDDAVKNVGNLVGAELERNIIEGVRRYCKRKGVTVV